MIATVLGDAATLYCIGYTLIDNDELTRNYTHGLHIIAAGLHNCAKMSCKCQDEEQNKILTEVTLFL